MPTTLVAATEIQPTTMTTDPLSKCQSYLFPKEQFYPIDYSKLLRSHSHLKQNITAVAVWLVRLWHYAHVEIQQHPKFKKKTIDKR